MSRWTTTWTTAPSWGGTSNSRSETMPCWRPANSTNTSSRRMATTRPLCSEFGSKASWSAFAAGAEQIVHRGAAHRLAQFVFHFGREFVADARPREAGSPLRPAPPPSRRSARALSARERGEAEGGDREIGDCGIAMVIRRDWIAGLLNPEPSDCRLPTCRLPVSRAVDRHRCAVSRTAGPEALLLVLCPLLPSAPGPWPPSAFRPCVAWASLPARPPASNRGAAGRDRPPDRAASRSRSSVATRRTSRVGRLIRRPAASRIGRQRGARWLVFDRAFGGVDRTGLVVRIGECQRASPRYATGAMGY